ncbi:MAG: hypothetical protein ACXW2A_15370 [Burkholderiales bacterium]
MKIIDAIRNAAAEEAVYFLLTSYLESFWASDQGEGLHPALRGLPIAGKDDVLRRSRLLDLECGSDSPVVAEAREIFRAARERLLAASTTTACSINAVRNDAPAINHVSR